MKLFASDFDGTLCFNGKISDNDRQAIQEWRAAGHIFAVVTGRSFPTITHSLDELGIDVDYIASNNGGFLWDTNRKVLVENYFEIEGARELLKDLTKTKATHLVLNDGVYRSVIKLREYTPKYFSSSDEAIGLDEALKIEKMAQIVVGGIDDNEASRIAHAINSEYHVGAAFRNTGCVDVVPYGVSKGEITAHLSELIGIDKDEVYTAGDGHNDLPMLEMFHGMTLHSAAQDIQDQVELVYDEVADYINELLK